MAMATRPPKNKWGLIKWERGWVMGMGDVDENGGSKNGSKGVSF